MGCGRGRGDLRPLALEVNPQGPEARRPRSGLDAASADGYGEPMSGLNIIGDGASPPPVETPFRISETGARGIAKFLATNQAPTGAAVRVGVRGGGCSGLSYVVEVDAGDARPGDLVLETSGGTVRVDKKSQAILQGVTLDYKAGLLDAGFQFVNPRATKTCGCGESFSM